MKVFVTGATGLIGASVCARLAAQGHEVVGAARRRPPSMSSRQSMVAFEMAAALDPDDWAPYLTGVEAVVNCAGVLQDSPRERTGAVHRDAASALFLACEQSGIRKVIHFSAIGVDRAQPSPFSASKHAGDKALMARDLDWVILRPSVVLGRPVFGASALFRGLAALPVLPSMPDTGQLQVVQLDDVVSTVVFFLDPDSPARITLELAGPEALGMDEVIELHRQWLGWRPAPRVRLPSWLSALLYRLGDFAGTFGWRPPIRSNAAKEIARGAVGDPAQWTAVSGIRPTGLSAALAANPATVQERWFARLYFLKPLTFVALPAFWILTGIISLTTGYENGKELLRDTWVEAWSEPLVILGALADMAAGALIAWRPTARLGLFGAIALCLFYAAAGTILRPDLWNEPLGPLLKIAPILILHLVALAILEER